MNEFVFDLQRFDSIENRNENTLVNGTDSRDTIKNYADFSTINGNGGDDYINNGDIERDSGYCVSINGGNGSDKIYNWKGEFVTLDGGNGDDTIENYEPKVLIRGGAGNDDIWNHVNELLTIYGGAGNDTIYNWGDDTSIYGEDGDDYIYSGSSNISIDGGVGNDEISLGSDYYNKSRLILYNEGDGDDTIYGFNSSDTLLISGSSYSTQTVLKNIIVTVGNGKITLKGAASLETVNIISGENYSWKLSGTTAKYGTSDKTLVTVKGVKSTDGLKVNDKVVTVSKSALNAKKVTISGDGYTLALDSDVSQPTTKKAAWTLKNSTATYSSSYKTAGYKLASNSKSIAYSKATTAETLATIKGAKSKTGLSVSRKKITLKSSALKSKVTIGGGYEFDFAKDYKNATITGSKNADTITARGKKISVNGGKGDDTIKILGSGTVSGGDGADIFYYKSSGSNVIADYAAEDKISIASGTAVTSTSGDDLILTVGKGKISVTGGANETVTYFDSDGEHIYKKSSDTLEGVKFTKSGKVVTLTDDYEADKFDVADFSNYKNKIVTINAAKVSQALEIIGNKKSNVITGTGTDDYIDGGAGADSIKGGNGNDKIYGGAGNDSILGGNGSDTLSGGTGNDSLWGGAGSDSIYGGLGDDYLVGGDGRDIFVYNNGDGHDYIDDYEQGVDKIMILSGEKPYLDRTNLSNNVTYIIGEGSLVVQNGINTTIEFVDSNNRLIDKSTPSKAG